MPKRRIRLNFSGIVQGVGFRPHVYRLAAGLNLSGFVCNRSDGVLVEIEGESPSLEIFLEKVVAERPAAAAINRLTQEELPPERISVKNPFFEIRASPKAGRQDFSVGPDLAVCDACLSELYHPQDRRYGYPFINCTNCGPRLTIVKDLPYDRRRTAMAGFPLCRRCQAEYDQPDNRRFHAEATSCPDCGPRLSLRDAEGNVLAEAGAALKLTGAFLRYGAIVAIKGIGGFHLAVAADNQEAVLLLRRRKHRETRPFALMVQDLEIAEELVHLNEDERRLLTSPARPIVLLEKKNPDPDNSGRRIAQAVAPGLAHYGIMLPYTPLHHLLFSAGLQILVMTSANRSDDPIVIDNQEAFTRLAGIADYVLIHDRDIIVRLDDSVTMIIDHQERILRRARGYVPQALELTEYLPTVLALGADLKNSLCLINRQKAFCSPHIGDLDSPTARDFFHENINLLKKITGVTPQVIACDRHPGYYSRQIADQLAPARVIPIQHHHAHIVSCMTDNQIKGPVLGLAMDGTGYGLDGQIWGGEFLKVDENGFRRLGQLSYFPLPGGELAIREPWRAALALLFLIYPENWWSVAQKLRLTPPDFSQDHLQRLLSQRRNRPLTSSLGRIFDAVAALLGLRHSVTFEGQAAIELEAAATTCRDTAHTPEVFGGAVEKHGDRRGEVYYQLNLLPLLQKLVQRILQGDPPEKNARIFHDSLIQALMSLAMRLCREYNLKQIALSGGCFQNRLLLRGCLDWPKRPPEISIYGHLRVPTNDGGLALGQAVCAARIINLENSMESESRDA
ncbi:MAG: carbamoyltransferase HypF [Deltaproteobacteria bacterium]|nr:carbamoyltransferase HypF [Deltaproteobacteria bacterium]